MYSCFAGTFQSDVNHKKGLNFDISLSLVCVGGSLSLLHPSDVNSMYLSSTEPPAAAEWACLLRPLRGREPEGIWNLLSIVREMFKRRDSNAAPLLEILTEQCLTYEQVTHTRPDTHPSSPTRAPSVQHR